MMYYERDDGELVGVLNDFDLAAVMDVGERTPAKKGLERTGTREFALLTSRLFALRHAAHCAFAIFYQVILVSWESDIIFYRQFSVSASVYKIWSVDKISVWMKNRVIRALQA